MNPFSPFYAVAATLFGGLVTSVVVYITYRKHKFALLNSLDDTITSIEGGRMSQVAVAEDYPTQKDLIKDLRPYRIFDSGFTIACKNYSDLYEKIYHQEPLLTFGVNPEATKVILEHLKALKGKV